MPNIRIVTDLHYLNNRHIKDLRFFYTFEPCTICSSTRQYDINQALLKGVTISGKGVPNYALEIKVSFTKLKY